MSSNPLYLQREHGLSGIEELLLLELERELLLEGFGEERWGLLVGFGKEQGFGLVWL